MSNPFTRPYLIFNAFFKTLNSAQDWQTTQQARLEVIPKDVSYGNLLDTPQKVVPQTKYELVYETITLQPDGHMVYLSVDKKGQHSSEAWHELMTYLVTPIWSEKFEDDCLGYTLILGAELAEDPTELGGQQWFANIPLPVKQMERPLYTHDGWHLWQITRRDEVNGFYAHVYVNLYTRVHQDLALDLTAGRMMWVELALHKAYQQAMHYFNNRDGITEQLSNSFDIIEQMYDNLEHSKNRQDLKTLREPSTNYLDFLHSLTKTTGSQQAIEVSLNNFQIFVLDIAIPTMQDQIFKTHERRIGQTITQLKYDNLYYETLGKRVEVGLETLRADMDFIQAEQDRRFEWLIGMLGLLLGMTQVWPIVQVLMDLQSWPGQLQVITNVIFLVVIGILAVITFIEYRRRRAS